jgi:hypothetical protein
MVWGRLFVVVVLVSCGEGKPAMTASPVTTRIEVTLDDGTKPPALDGRAFAVVDKRGSLDIYVFDQKAPEMTCTDVSVGGWMESLSAGSAVVVRVARFSGGKGQYPIASIAHVRGGKKMALRSASPKGATINVERWDELFEVSLGKAGQAAGIVCASK